MSRWKAPLLETYYRATLPYRWLAEAVESHRSTAPVSILFYHRVADSYPNGWSMTRASFARQMDWLSQRFDMVSLAEAQRRIVRGSRRPAVSITFDDGYGENCEFALPLLIERGIPCTYFVTLKNVLEGVPFPHDVERGEPLRPNTIEELRELSRAGIEIAAHTRTHADLGKITDTDQLYDEVVLAGQELGYLLDTRIRYFAFPFGQQQNLNDEATSLARRAGYEAVCSAFGGKNRRGEDPFQLRRFHGDPLLARIKNWTTPDPRELLQRKQATPQARSLAGEPGREAVTA